MSLLDRIRSWFPAPRRLMGEPNSDEQVTDPRHEPLAEAPRPLAEDVRPPTERS